MIELRQNGKIYDYLQYIWDVEQQQPQVYRDASESWTANFESFQEFVNMSKLVYGWFDGDKLIAVVYFQEEKNGLNTHLSILERKFNIPSLIKELIILRDKVLANHTNCLYAWVLQKNIFLRRIVESIGFRAVNLTMKHGNSREKVLNWQLLRILVAKDVNLVS